MKTKFNFGQHIKLSSKREWNPIFKDADGYILLIIIDEKGIHYQVKLNGNNRYPFTCSAMEIQMIEEKDLEAYE